LGLEPEATFFPAATSTQIAEVEAALEVRLPDDLSSLLAESNGVYGTYGLGLIWSVERIQACNRKMRTAPHFLGMYMPFDSLLFFADAGNGDQFAFCIIQGAIRRPRVFVWNHEDDSRTCAAPSLELYIKWWLSGELRV
jgi:hypothetical protein